MSPLSGVGGSRDPNERRELEQKDNGVRGTRPRQAGQMSSAEVGRELQIIASMITTIVLLIQRHAVELELAESKLLQLRAAPQTDELVKRIDKEVLSIRILQVRLGGERELNMVLVRAQERLMGRRLELLRNPGASKSEHKQGERKNRETQ